MALLPILEFLPKPQLVIGRTEGEMHHPIGQGSSAGKGARATPMPAAINPWRVKLIVPSLADREFSMVTSKE